MFILIWLLITTAIGLAAGSEEGLEQALGSENQLKFPWGVNFKLNGKLHHHIDRIWVVTKLEMPDLGDIPLEDLKVEKVCEKWKTARLTKGFDSTMRTRFEALCTSAYPYLHHLAQQEQFYKQRIAELIQVELPLLLPKPSTETTSTRVKRGFGAVLPAVASLFMVVYEQISHYLQAKRDSAISKGLVALSSSGKDLKNEVRQLEEDFLLYGHYNIESLTDIVGTIHDMHARQSVLESSVMNISESLFRRYTTASDGKVLYSFRLKMYMKILEERHSTLYRLLQENLEELVRGISKLSKGYLPPEIFSPSKLKAIEESVAGLLADQHPSYELAVTDLSDYYDMKLVTFGIHPDKSLVVTFPIFVKHRDRKVLDLYEIETVPVPIPLQTPKSWTRAVMPKPYIAVDDGHSIELRLPELRMCKLIHFVYYCEELFLLKEKSKYSCASAMFFDLSSEQILENCEFDLLHERSIVPSILDGGKNVVLANMQQGKQLICNSGYSLALPLPQEEYVMINRSTLCYCSIDADLAYVVQTLGACDLPPGSLTVYHTINLAVYTMFKNRLSDLYILENPVMEPEEEPPSLVLDLPPDSDPSHPTHLKAMASLLSLHTASSLPASEDEDSIEAQLEAVLQHKGSKIFQFCMATMTVALLIWLAYMTISYAKMKVWMLGLGLQNLAPFAKAQPLFKTTQTPTLPPETNLKMVCQDPWVSIVLTVITVLGLLVFLYKEFRNYSLKKGILYQNKCTLHLFISQDCYYAPLELLKTMGLINCFFLNKSIRPHRLVLHQDWLWDTLEIDWTDITLRNNARFLMVPTQIVIPLWKKWMVRSLMTNNKNYDVCVMVRQGKQWYEVKVRTHNPKRYVYPWEGPEEQERSSQYEPTSYADEPTPATSGPSFAMSSSSSNPSTGHSSLEVPSSSSGEKPITCRRSLKFEPEQTKGEAKVLE